MKVKFRVLVTLCDNWNSCFFFVSVLLGRTIASQRILPRKVATATAIVPTKPTSSIILLNSKLNCSPVNFDLT